LQHKGEVVGVATTTPAANAVMAVKTAVKRMMSD
jgi:hypothetical protein